MRGVASGGDPWAVSRRTGRGELCQERTRAQAKGAAVQAKAPRSQLGSFFLEVRSGRGEGPGGSGAQGWREGHPRCARAQRPVFSPAPCSYRPGDRIITAENSVYCSLLIRKIPEAYGGEFGKCGEV